MDIQGAKGDVDIGIAISHNNAWVIVELLKEFGSNVPELSNKLFLEQKKVVRMGVPPIRIKIITDYRELTLMTVKSKGYSFFYIIKLSFVSL